jgi:hypothetical protein
MAVNQEERAICRRRGHDIEFVFTGGWVQCKWCGTWLRQIKTIEEREDAPPENERGPFAKLRKEIARNDA